MQGNAASLLIEVVARSFDAYSALGSASLNRHRLERAMVICRQRHASGAGHIFIEDNGAGYSPKAARNSGLIQWALLGAGSKVVIESTAKGAAGRFRLEINVRRIYERGCIGNDIEVLLRDCKCSSLSVQKCERNEEYGATSPIEYGTTLTIECDGERECVNGHVLNRFYEFTDPADKRVREILASTPCFYSGDGKAQNSGRQARPSIYLDGVLLYRRG